MHHPEIGGDENQREIASVWIKYFTFRCKKAEKNKNDQDPILDALLLIKAVDFKTSDTKDIFKRNKDPSTLLKQLAELFELNTPIKTENLELVRVSVISKIDKKNKKYVPTINALIMRTYIKFCYNLKNELRRVLEGIQMVNFNDTIFSYLGYFFAYLSTTDTLYEDFQIVSNIFYDALIRYSSLLVKANYFSEVSAEIFRILPEMLICICKEAKTPYKKPLEFISSIINVYVDCFSENNLKHLPLLHTFIITVMSYFPQFTKEKKALIHNIACKILEIFKTPHAKNSELYLSGLNSLALEVKYNNISFGNSIKGCVNFIKWATEEYAELYIQFPEINPNSRHFQDTEEDLKVEYITVNDYQSDAITSRKMINLTSLTTVKEINEIYPFVSEMKKKSVNSPQISMEMSNSVVSALLEIKKKTSFQIFLCIALTLIYDLNPFCIKESVQQSWNIFFDETIFAVEEDEIESRTAKLFIKQMKEFVINFIISKCSENNQISEEVLKSLSKKILASNDTFFYNILPFFKEMSFISPEMFIVDIACTGCLDVFIERYKANSKNQFGVMLFNFIQVISFINPVPIFNNDKAVIFLFDMLQRKNTTDIVTKMILDALPAVAIPKSNEQKECFMKLLDFVGRIFEKGIDNDEEMKKIAIDFIPVLNGLVQTTNDEILYEALSKNICPLVAEIAKTKEEIKTMLMFQMYAFETFPSIAESILMRGSKLKTYLIEAIQAIEIDDDILDILTTVLFGHEMKFKEFSIIKNKGFIPVYIDCMQGKPREKDVIEYILDLVSHSRLNAFLCCEGQCFQECLNRLAESKPEEAEFVKTLLLLIMNLFEQFPSATFLLKMVPAIKSGLASEDSFWPPVVLNFIKKLCSSNEVIKYPYYISMQDPNTYISGPKLPANALNGEWTFATKIRISNMTPKGSPVPLFSVESGNKSIMSLIIKDNGLAYTSVLPKSTSNIELFPYHFNTGKWYFMKVVFASNEVTFFCDFTRIGTVPRSQIMPTKDITIYIGTFNDPKIKKRAIIEISDSCVVNGDCTNTIDSNSIIESIPENNHICSFKVSTSKYNTMDVVSPYGDKGKFVGYYLPPLIDFATLFEIDGVWNSFFVLFFSAGDISDCGPDSLMALLPKIATNIIKKNKAAEKTLCQMDGFSIICDKLVKVNGNIELSIFSQYYELFKVLTLDESKKSMILHIWMHPEIYKHVTDKTAEYCVGILHEVSKDNEQLFSQIITDPCAVSFFVQISEFNDEGKSKPFVRNIMRDFISAFKKCQTKKHYEVLTNLLSAKLNSDEISLCIELAEEFLVSNNEDFARVISPPIFINLVKNPVACIHRLALRCLQLIVYNENIVKKEEKISIVLNVTESVDIMDFDLSDIFLDSYDYLFGLYGTNKNIRKTMDFIETQNESFIFKCPAFITLLAATSTYVDKTLVKKVIKHLITNMKMHKESCDGICDIPYWPYWIIILCQNGYEPNVALSKISRFANLILYKPCSLGNYEPVKKALSLLDIISSYLNINLHDEKKTILYSMFICFPEKKQNPTDFSGFVSSVFSLVFIHTTYPYNNSITLKNSSLRVSMLDKASEVLKNISTDLLKSYVHLNKDNMWVDHDIASLAVELMARWIYNKESYDLAPHLPLVTTFAYMLTIMMQFMPSQKKILGDKFLRSIKSNRFLPTTEEGHRAIGIFLACAKKFESFDKGIIEKLDEMFEEFNEDDDSYELEKFIFESEIQSNIRSIYLINFV